MMKVENNHELSIHRPLQHLVNTLEELRIDRVWRLLGGTSVPTDRQAD